VSQLELRHFLETIWGIETGVVRLATRNKDLRFRTTLYRWPIQEEEVLQFIEGNEAANNEVYFSPDLFKLEAMQLKRATKDLVLGSRVICLDFDGNAPDSSVWDDPGEFEGMPEPSFIVQSSKVDNQHIYWVLDEFITDIKLLEDMRRNITYKMKADGSGWDAGQLLRPPFTTNYGYVKERTETYPVFIERLSDRAYSAVTFKPPDNFVPLVSTTIDADTLPTVSTILAEGTFVHGFTDLFTKSLKDLDGRERSGALCQVAYYAAESGLSDTEIYALVQDADTRWGKYVGRTDRHRQLCGIVDRARAKHPAGYSEIGFGEGWDGAVDEADVAPKAVYNFGELSDLTENIEWFFNNMMATKGYGIFAGPPGIGKTQLVIRFGKAVALGESFLCWSPATPGQASNVLLLELEMEKLGIKKFFHDMADLQEEPVKSLLSERFHVYPMSREILLDTDKSKRVFEQLIQMYKPQLVIIDSLNKAVSKDLSNEEVVRRLNSYLADLRRIFGCAIVVVHHSRKRQSQDKGPSDIDVLMGSRYISSEADFILLFERHGDSSNQIKVTSAKMRYCETEAPFIIERDHQLNFTYSGTAKDVMSASNSLLEGFKDAMFGGNTGPGRGDPASESDSPFG